MLGLPIYLIVPLAWAFIFFIGMVLRHERRMAEIRHAERTGQPLPRSGPPAWAQNLSQMGQNMGKQAEDWIRNVPPLPGQTPAGQNSPDTNAEVEQLRERIKVLERIVTDQAAQSRSRDLADEIEKLR